MIHIDAPNKIFELSGQWDVELTAFLATIADDNSQKLKISFEEALDKTFSKLKETIIGSEKLAASQNGNIKEALDFTGKGTFKQ